MFSNLKSAIQKVTSKTTEEDEYKGEDVQAVIILLLEACQIDGETGQVELDYIKKLLVNKFGFNEKDANDNISKALEDSEQRIESFSQIKVILNEMNHEERIEVIQMMWGVILADGVIDDFEANLMRRMNGLLYVSGVESAAAKENAILNKIDNVDFFVGDMKTVFNSEFIETHGHPDVIITDPPRDGMHKDVVAQIIKIKPDRIVYVSCNSATQARDLALLDSAYKITKTQAVDMFPQTHHVENVVLLEKRNSKK